MRKVQQVSLAFMAAGIAACPPPAFANSTTEPGFTTGVPLYAPELPVGLYLDVVPDISHRNTNPDTEFRALTPFFVLQTPLKVADARIMVVAAPVYASLKVKGQVNLEGFYNSYVGVQGTWNLGNAWGLGVRLAGWIPQKGEIASSYGTFAPRVGVTRITAKEHFTASFECGYPLEGKAVKIAPNYANLDLTYTRTRGKLEYGAVSYLSADTNSSNPLYQKQAQIAVGPLLGYNFGKVQVQAKFTTDIYQKNYGAAEKRLQFNINIPLWTSGQS